MSSYASDVERVKTCPDVFELQDDGLSHVIDATACSECECQEAADSCPS